MITSVNEKTEIKPRASRWEKQKKNFERQIAVIDRLDNYYGKVRDLKRLKKFGINYDLMNGRLDTKLYEAPESINIMGETVTIKQGEIPHIPMIAQVTNAMRGEQQFKPWKMSVEDMSPLKDTIELEEYTKLLQDYISNNIIAANEQKATQQFMESLDEETLALLSPEDLQQLQAQIETTAQSMTPDQIIEFMSNEYKNPIAKQGQEMMNFLDRHFQLKTKEVEGFTHALPTAEEYYYANVGERGLEFDMVPPDSLEYGGPLEEEWVQKMDWAKREKWTTITDIKIRYAEVLKKEHIDELDKYYEPIFTARNHKSLDEGPATRRYQYEFSVDPEGMIKQFGDQDPTKRANFSNISTAYAHIQSKYGAGAAMSDYAIRETHFVWKDERKMYRVFRIENGILKKYYFDEHYQKTAEDFSVKEIYVPEVWEGTKIGTDDPIYLNIRPLKYQYKNLDDPFSVELPYIGKKYNIFRNRSENVSVIDLMKQFQRDYDTEMASLRKDMRTNMGRMFMMLVNAKPDNLKWEDFIKIGKDYNFLLVDGSKKGMQADPNWFREINMSKMSEIADRIVLLREILNNLYSVAGFNMHRVGQGGQYATNGNITQQQQSSYNQTESMFETHRLIVEAALNRLMNVARMYYKDNPELLKNILSPTSMVELEVGYPFWYTHFNIYLETSGKVARQIEALKQYIQAFIQNGMKPRDIIELALAESRNDLHDILMRVDKETQEQIQQANEQAQQQVQMELQDRAAARQEEAQLKLQMQQSDITAKAQRAKEDAQKFAYAQDINQNNTSDLYEAKLLELQQRNKEHEEKMDLEYRKLEKLGVNKLR